MTQDDIIRIALEAGFCKDSNGIYFRRAVTPDSDLLPLLEHFAALATAEKDKEIKRLQDLLYTQLGELTALRAEKQMRGHIKELQEQPR